MFKGIIVVLLAISANFAQADLWGDENHVDCNDCETLNKFGIAGARHLWADSDGWGWSLLNDKVWVTNELTGVAAHVDLDMAYTRIWFFNIEIQIPNATETIIKVVYYDVADSTELVVPNDFLVPGLYPTSVEQQSNDGGEEGADDEDSRYEEDDFGAHEFDDEEDFGFRYHTGVEDGKINDDGIWEPDTSWEEEL